MEPFWYENLLDKGCQLCVWVACHGSLDGLKMQPFEPCRPSPRCMSSWSRGPEEDALAPFSQWAGALSLTQAFSADHQTSSGPTDRLLPSFFRWKMEDLGQGHTAPQGQSQKSAFLALDTVPFALPDTLVLIHRFVGQKFFPVQKGWWAVGNSLFLIICQYSSSFSLTVTNWDWFQPSLQWFSLTTRETVPVCHPTQIRQAKEGKLHSDIFKLKTMSAKSKLCSVSDIIITRTLSICVLQAITVLWEPSSRE